MKFEVSEHNFTEGKVVHYSCNVQNWISCWISKNQEKYWHCTFSI